MEDGVRMPYIGLDGVPFPSPKGYTCPQNSKCITSENPYDGTISFDNILQSLELVFVIMSFNTFTDIMYDIVAAEHLIASLFFIVGSLALGLWLANLFIAVIVTSFKTTREEGSSGPSSGDAAKRVAALFAGSNVHVKHVCRTKLGRFYHYCREIPPIAIAVDLVLQANKNYASKDHEILSVYHYQVFITTLLAFEILWRFLVYLPEVRLFFSSTINIVDLILAITTSVIILPPIQNHTIVYAWLSFFQVARFYRVVIAAPFVRDLWARVLSNVKPILNITVFYYLITYLVAILACELLRGIIPQFTDGDQNFFQFQHLANSFVALYTISTTENWTDILYTAVESADSKFAQGCIAAFFIGWFILSNYVVLNMFVAIITDNLDISPEGKKREQIKAFIIGLVNEKQDHRGFTETRNMVLEKLKIKKRTPTPYTDQTALQMVLQDNNMDNFLNKDEGISEYAKEKQMLDERNSRSLLKTLRNLPFFPIKYWVSQRRKQLENPFHERNEIREYDGPHHGSSDAIVTELIRAKDELEAQRKEYLEVHPDYNKSLKLFRPHHPIRKFCQKIVAPSYGVRLEGYNPRPLVWYCFSTFMLLSTLVLVVLACITTPIYYKNLTMTLQPEMNWVIVTDAILVGIFTIESITKIIADGFYFAPNAYLRSIWGVVDFAVLITMWINLVEEVHSRTTVARVIRAFKALRALRLLSFSPKAQELFHSVIIVGVWKLFSASIVAFGLLFPFSVWGLNIFSGRLFFCNNSDFSGNLTNCFGEYENSPFNWNVHSPQTVVNDYFDFNDFGGSLLVLFEIISLEGWVDVLQTVMNISPGFAQPEYYADAFNSVFVMFYNLVGTIFILTLFISVIIQNYSVVRGSAFMTTDQKAWYEIESMLRVVRPSVRPERVIPGSFRDRILKLILSRNSWLNISMTVNLVLIAIMLITEFYPQKPIEDTVRSAILFVMVFCYFVFVLLRAYALGIKKFFRRRWDVFALVVTTSSGVLVFLGLVWIGPNSTVFFSFQRLCLVGMLILLMPRSKRLDQLLKTCAASASSIGNLLIVWAILYLTYGIAFNQVFGLTRIGPNGSPFVNFRTVPNALVLLFRMSCGEGWNQILSDFLVEAPYCYVSQDGYTDCGSKGYAFLLFISWNILSMYIFCNMFVSLIYENFSYVSRKPDSKINRDEIRKFKRAWFEFDPEGTGYIRRDDLYRFLGKCEGYFSLKIHDEEWKVNSILRNSRARTTDKYNVDVHALNKELRNYPSKESAARRHTLDKFCQHAFLLAHPIHGISFNQLLMQFPFYKDMEYCECLKLRDYIQYRDIERRVMARIMQERSTNAILTAQAVVRRRFKLNQFARNRSSYEQENPFASPEDFIASFVPAIHVEAPGTERGSESEDESQAASQSEDESQESSQISGVRRDSIPLKGRNVTLDF